jgi:hypothetical protein
MQGTIHGWLVRLQNCLLYYLILSRIRLSNLLISLANHSSFLVCWVVVNYWGHTENTVNSLVINMLCYICLQLFRVWTYRYKAVLPCIYDSILYRYCCRNLRRGRGDWLSGCFVFHQFAENSLIRLPTAPLENSIIIQQKPQWLITNT